jgi:hypothetical protein
MKMGIVSAALAAALTTGGLIGASYNFTFGPQRLTVPMGTTLTGTNQAPLAWPRGRDPEAT